MYTVKALNPKTNRRNTFNCFQITWNDAIQMIKDGKSAKDISWAMLSSINPDDVDESESIALNIFENALDYGLGIKVVSWIKHIISYGKKQEIITVGANRQGDCFILVNDRVVF